MTSVLVCDSEMGESRFLIKCNLTYNRKRLGKLNRRKLYKGVINDNFPAGNRRHVTSG